MELHHLAAHTGSLKMKHLFRGVSYGSEEQCHAALVAWRWPAGFECPDCGGKAHCVVERGARKLFQCNACRKQTSVRAGTIFPSSKLPLRVWFKAMYQVTQSKQDVSGLELSRRLGDHLQCGAEVEAQAGAGHARAQREEAAKGQGPDGRRLSRRRALGLRGRAPKARGPLSPPSKRRTTASHTGSSWGA